MITSNDNFELEPLKFLRCHSKNNDNADLQTQVWDCAFEPTEDYFSPSCVVATCGGNSVCFIDCARGNVISKYYTKDISVLLFSLAWTKLHSGAQQKKILVTGGAKGTLYFIDFSSSKCVLEYQIKCKRNVSINTLNFHPQDHAILFCGTSNGEIRICELKRYLNEPEKLDLLINNCTTVKSEVFDFAFCLSSKILLASCNDGIFTFNFPTRESLRSSREKRCVNLRVTRREQINSNLVDSIEVLKEGLIACKYALDSCIYICDLKPLSNVHNEDIISLDLEPLYSLKWSSTDNYFMYMGVNVDCSLLCCGDDKGSLWLYNLENIFKKSNGTDSSNIGPSSIVPWPHVTDHYNDKKRKLNLDVYDIVIDKVGIHPSGAYIVAVTNNNLVCIWKNMKFVQ